MSTILYIAAFWITILAGVGAYALILTKRRADEALWMLSLNVYVGQVRRWHNNQTLAVVRHVFWKGRWYGPKTLYVGWDDYTRVAGAGRHPAKEKYFDGPAELFAERTWPVTLLDPRAYDKLYVWVTDPPAETL